MYKRLTMVLPAVMLLAACSGSGSGNDTTAPTAPSAAPSPAATAPATTTPAAAPAASASAAPATPAPASTAAAKPAPPSKPASTFVDDGKWVEGKNYFRIEPAQPKVTGTDKIEVVEAFSYGCPACFQAHTTIDKLEASLPADAVMVYLPVSFRPDENWPVYQRAFYTAQALGIAAKSHDAMFDATWTTGETATYDLAKGRPKPQPDWPTIDDIAKFYTKFGVSKDEFVAVSKSFSVETKMKRADELQKDYGVEATPTIVVDGKYRFDGRSAGSYANMVDLAKWLVAKEEAGK